MDEINELKRSGMSIVAISNLTGYDRKTIRKYLLKPVQPLYAGRPATTSKLEPFKAYLNERLKAEPKRTKPMNLHSITPWTVAPEQKVAGSIPAGRANQLKRTELCHPQSRATICLWQTA